MLISTLVLSFVCLTFTSCPSHVVSLGCLCPFFVTPISFQKNGVTRAPKHSHLRMHKTKCFYHHEKKNLNDIDITFCHHAFPQQEAIHFFASLIALFYFRNSNSVHLLCQTAFRELSSFSPKTGFFTLSASSGFFLVSFFLESLDFLSVGIFFPSSSSIFGAKNRLYISSVAWLLSVFLLLTFDFGTANRKIVLMSNDLQLCLDKFIVKHCRSLTTVEMGNFLPAPKRKETLAAVCCTNDLSFEILRKWKEEVVTTLYVGTKVDSTADVREILQPEGEGSLPVRHSERHRRSLSKCPKVTYISWIRIVSWSRYVKPIFRFLSEFLIPTALETGVETQKIGLTCFQRNDQRMPSGACCGQWVLHGWWHQSLSKISLAKLLYFTLNLWDP